MNNQAYIDRFNKKLTAYNTNHGTTYTFKDIQAKFIDVRLIDITNININDSLVTSCMCGHKISRPYNIINPETNETMALGSDCIETYMLNSHQICEICDTRFKFKANTIICKDCKKTQKQAAKQAAKQAKLDALEADKINKRNTWLASEKLCKTCGIVKSKYPTCVNCYKKSG